MENRTKEIVRSELNDLLRQAKEYEELFAMPGWKMLNKEQHALRMIAQNALADLVLQDKKTEMHSTAAIIKARLEMEEREETIMEELRERGIQLQRELESLR